MKKNRLYTRELTTSQIKELQSKYKEHEARTKRGFLSTRQRSVLLHKSKMGKRTDIPDHSDFFHTMRENSKTAFGDYLLLIDTLTDSQLENVFSVFKIKDDNSFSLLTVLNRLFESEKKIVPVKNRNDKTVKLSKEPLNVDDKWKALLAEALLKSCIDFFRTHRYISTEIHERFLYELEQMINVEISRASQIPISNRFKGIA